MSQDVNQIASLRAQNVEARRQRILEAARRLIAGGGMQALSMRKLAQEAGLSVTTLYNLLGSRDAILEAVVHDAIDRIDPILEREAPLDDPIERCRAIITVSVPIMAEELEAVFRPMIQAVYEGLSLRRMEAGSVSARAVEMQRVAIEKAIETGQLRDILDPAVLASQVYHGYDLACCQWAYGLLDAAGFQARALYGLYIVLLAVATDATRPQFEQELSRLEAELEEAPTWTGKSRSAS